MKPTHQELALALLFLLDGTPDHDINGPELGLARETCDRIIEIRQAAKEAYPNWTRMEL